MSIRFLTCSLFNTSCRHVSMETTLRPYTRLEKDTRTGLFKPSGLGNTIVELGEFCNDAGRFIEQMHYCPVIWANANLKNSKIQSPTMPFKKGYRKVQAKSGKTFMAPKIRSKSKKNVKKLDDIYASCRSSEGHSADTPENKGYCARVAYAKSGA